MSYAESTRRIHSDQARALDQETIETPDTGQLQRRFVADAKPVVDVKSRTCALSFSSTAPVRMAHGTEILSHAPGACDLTRMNRGAAVLFNHNANDPVGVVQSASIAGDKGRATVRFGKDARGEWAMGQVQDGILRNVSVTYAVSKYEKSRSNPDHMIATKWEPYELSLVTIPADTSVGVGRSIQTRRTTTMDHDTDDTTTQDRGTRSQRASAAAEAERTRMLELGAMGRKYGLPERQILAMQQDGTSIDDARARVMEHQRTQQRDARPVSSSYDEGSAYLGLTDRETQEFSILRAVNASISRDWKDAGFEAECSRSVAQKLGKQTQGFFVPSDVLSRSSWTPHAQQQRAAYAVGTPGAGTTGGTLVATELFAGSFIEVLRNQSAVMAAGATTLSGLVGAVDIPRQISQTGTFWVAEGVNVGESEAQFDKVSLNMKTIGAYSQISRNMLMQSTPDIEALVRADLIAVIALGVDLAALSGTGPPMPVGIANAATIGAYIGGVNGAAVTLDTVIAMEKVLAQANAPLNGRAYIMNPATIASLKTLKASTGAYLWTTAPTGQRSSTPGTINGYPLFQTNQARSTLTKGTSVGVCSEIFFGAWSELLIGEWGVLEIVPNPYDAAVYKSGGVLLRAMQSLDIGIRHPASFVLMSDALTP